MDQAIGFVSHGSICGCPGRCGSPLRGHRKMYFPRAIAHVLFVCFFSVMAVMASQSHEKYSYLGIIIPLHSDGLLVGNRISRGAQGWNYVIQNWLLGFASVIHFQSQPITVRFKHTTRTFITVSSVWNTTHLCLDTLFWSPGLQGFSWCSTMVWWDLQ